MLLCVQRGGCSFRSGGSFRCGRALSVAAVWAGAAHPRRQKHREMPPPGASAPAFAATVEPVSMQTVYGETHRQRVMERVLKMCCMDCPCFDLLAASIRKSGLEIKNQCADCPCFDLLAASIRKSGLEIENRCSAIVPASRTARLQRSRGVQAGTGCHEGGIILSKKPPEWHLATPQQRYRVRFFFSLPQSITACLQQALPPGCCN